jgi:hypothetical protein
MIRAISAKNPDFRTAQEFTAMGYLSFFSQFSLFARRRVKTAQVIPKNYFQA